MTDKELLELAAKAAGYDFHTWGGGFAIADKNKKYHRWNPLLDDADAFQLMVKLDFEIRFSYKFVSVSAIGAWEEDSFTSETKNAVVRKMITRAAAEIGKGI